MATTTKKTRRPGQFNYETKAQLYAWDNAVCAITGASLWMLDYGATSLCHSDWADHVRPRARGGGHDPSNGISVAEEANLEKNANGRVCKFMYVAGQPTWRAFATFGKVPQDTARYLRRDVLPRDWFFNRSLTNLMWFVFGDVEGWTGTRIKARPMYYPRAAWRFLQTFRKCWQHELKVDSGPTVRQARLDWKSRGLIPTTLGPDQQLMLRVLAATDCNELAAIGQLLASYLKINDRWVEKFDRWVATCEKARGRELLTDLRDDRRVTPYVRRAIQHNVDVLAGARLWPRDGGRRVRPLARRVQDF